MYEFLEYRVADAMTSRPVTIARATPLGEVEALFEAHDYDCLPVCDGDGALVGVVSKVDFLRAFAFTPESIVPPYDEIMRRPAASVMSQKPLTVTPEMSLTRVLQLMIDTRHRSFPVVIGALPIGMIARTDVMRALRRAAAGEPTRHEEVPSGRPDVHP